jgi:hypothetical protein
MRDAYGATESNFQHRRRPLFGRKLARTALAAAISLGAAIAGGTAVAQAAPTSRASLSRLAFPRASGHLTEMIIMLRTPSGSASYRTHYTHLVQAALVSRLRGAGAQVVATTMLLDTVIARISTDQMLALSADPAVARVLPVTTIPAPAPLVSTGDPLGQGVASSGGPANTSVLCGTKSKPQLNPEALKNINYAGASALGVDGQGVSVAFLAGGIDPNNADFIRNRAFGKAGSHVITKYADFGGDGTAAPSGDAAVESFGDASSIAAQGNYVFDLSQFVNTAHPLPKGCDIKIQGDAPGASLIAEDIFPTKNLATSSDFIQAINYAVENGAKVINESFGGNAFPDLSLDLTRQANDAAAAAGVTVVVSSGDSGLSNTQGSPSTDPNVISAGASTTFRAYAQNKFGGINWPGWNGKWVDNNLSSLSSSGFTQTGQTLDLVAPGDLNWADCSANTKVVLAGFCTNENLKPSNLQQFGGTSESAPLVSGAAADVIEAYAKTHRGQDPSPALVKQILTSTATDILAPANEQGAGLLNIGKAVRLAESLPGSTSPSRTGGLLIGPSQINFTGAPHQSATRVITVTNTGTNTARVALSTRTVSEKPTATVTGSFCMNPAHKAAPGCPVNTGAFPIWSGAVEVYQTQNFTVGAGVDRLQFVADYPFTGQTSLLHFALFDPSGTYTAYSLPQGLGDYGSVDVNKPVAGKWTAVFFTLENGSQGTGTSGTINWSATSWAYKAGSRVPSTLTIRPGKTAVATLLLDTGGTAGDFAESVVVKSGYGQTTVPVTVRTLVGIGPNGGKFYGLLTGGNGRGGAPAEENTYAFSIPSGKASLNVRLHMQSSPAGGIVFGDELLAYLIDPTGQAVSYSTNYSASPAGKPIAIKDVMLYHVNPIAGTWRVILQWANPVVGNELSIPFSGEVSFNAFALQANSVPNSATATIPQKKATPFALEVCDPAPAPEAFFVDPRLETTAKYPLANVIGTTASQVAGNITMPNADLWYAVPTDTTELQASIGGTIPLTFDFSYIPGDPDVSPVTGGPGVSGSESKKLAYLSYSNAEVSPGIWNFVPAEIGPYPAGGEASGSARVRVNAVTRRFDSSVTSSTGDFWKLVTLITKSSFHPIFLTPGTARSDCGKITVTITPSAGPGTVVSGTLYLDDFVLASSFNPSSVPIPSTIFPMADQVLAIPYKYKVG